MHQALHSVALSYGVIRVTSLPGRNKTVVTWVRWHIPLFCRWFPPDSGQNGLN